MQQVLPDVIHRGRTRAWGLQMIDETPSSL
jgi:hypothetical protein